MIKYNIDKLIRIKVIEFTINKEWGWQEEKRIFGIKVRSKGWVNQWDGVMVSNESPRPYNFDFSSYNSIANGKEVFIQPRVIVSFCNNYGYKKYFDSKEGAINYANELAKKSKAEYIEIE